VHEIFDVQWLPGLRWPELFEPDDSAALQAYFVPESSLAWF
jgi:hypothetical protein